jgi:hypothetical protein
VIFEVNGAPWPSGATEKVRESVRERNLVKRMIIVCDFVRDNLGVGP